MKKILIGLLAVAVFLACKPGDIPFSMDEWSIEARDQFNSLGIPDEDTNFKHDYTTPAGIRIKSVKPIPSEYLALADAGVQRQIERFRVIFPDWEPTPINQRRALVIEPSTNQGTGLKCVTEFNDPGAPCLYIVGQKAAATVLGLDDLWQKLDQFPPVVVPHQEYQGWTKQQYWQDSFEYESEHLEGFKHRHIDAGPWFHYQGANDAHPWTWPPATGLKSPQIYHCLPAQ